MRTDIPRLMVRLSAWPFATKWIFLIGKLSSTCVTVVSSKRIFSPVREGPLLPYCSDLRLHTNRACSPVLIYLSCLINCAWIRYWSYLNCCTDRNFTTALIALVLPYWPYLYSCAHHTHTPVPIDLFFVHVYYFLILLCSSYLCVNTLQSRFFWCCLW